MIRDLALASELQLDCVWLSAMVCLFDAHLYVFHFETATPAEDPSNNLAWRLSERCAADTITPIRIEMSM